jgi:signal transduction histidine kinase/CheY-like chemotaxis protein
VTPEINTVLVVDDREANRYTTVHALTRAGFQVVEADTGKKALELARNRPAVIVLDVKLPDILGYEVCRRIKANAQTRHIPVLQLSAAFLSNESKLFALESGADAYLIQPADPVVLVATVRSLVRLHSAESTARIAAQQWQATFDALSEGVAIVDANGTIQRCNRAMTSCLGKTYGEIEGASVPVLLRQCFGPQTEIPEGTRLVELKAGSRFFRLSFDPISSSEGVLEGRIFIVGETTKQKLAEEALLISERLAATGRISHTIAHEINNPLEALTNLLYLMKGSLDQPEVVAGFLETATTELSRVARITKQILSFNREASKPVAIRISEIIEDVLALNNRALVEKRLRIRTEWNASLQIRGFPAQLRQVFSNLIRNAVEASFPDGEIWIRTSDTRFWNGAGARAVRVVISDQGVGIPPENIERIFDAFFTTKDLKGSGIGLWLCSTIVHEHGGTLRVRSTTRPTRSGTCLSVLLPTDSKEK